jgi:hypothetical protein
MVWRPVAVSPRQFIEEEQPSRVRVWQDGRATQFREPVINGDTLSSSVSTEPAGIALTDIAVMEWRQFSTSSSVLLGVGLLATFFVFALVEYSSSGF